MKPYLCIGFILLLSAQLHAETYSWVDDGGTYNYTEDYSKVPKKYQKKMKRRENLPQTVKPLQAPDPETMPRQTEKTDAKSASVPDGDKELYGGKSRAAWRKELDAKEAELNDIEQRLEQVRKQIYDTKGIDKAQFETLKRDYDDYRATYNQKYKSYSELIETVRKAGIMVEIKK